MDGAALAAVRKRNRELYPCKIDGCPRTAYKGDLCRNHYQLVPLTMKLQAANEANMAAYRVGRKWHRRQLAYARKMLAGSTGG